MKKNLILLSLLTAMLLSVTACGGSADLHSSVAETEATIETTEPPTEATTEKVIPTHAPFPEADANAVTFDDGNFAFATIICDDGGAADGTLSVENVDGNAMLKYTDTTTTAENFTEMVQKVSINLNALLSPEQIESVHSIAFDMYAEAEADLFVNDDGENLKVPGWIGGGGGTTVADGKWYSFADFAASSINEFDLERSDAYRVEFKFLLASAGKKWTAEMEEVNLLIMRWGLQNLSSTYIDNITFYDADGNSIPLTLSAPSEEGSDAAETTDETEETAQEELASELAAEEEARGAMEEEEALREELASEQAAEEEARAAMEEEKALREEAEQAANSEAENAE